MLAALALATLLSALPAKAASISASLSMSNLQLTLTDPDGQSTSYPEMAPTGDIKWQPSLILLLKDANNTLLAQGAELPTPDADSPVVMTMTGPQELVSFSSTASTSTGINSSLQYDRTVSPTEGIVASTVSFSSEGGISNAVMRDSVNGIADFGNIPVTGGFWLSAHSTATLTSTFSGSVQLDNQDGAFDLNQPASASGLGTSILLMIPDSYLIYNLDPGFFQVASAELSLNLQAQTPGQGPQQSFQEAQLLSVSINNPLDVGQWVLVGSSLQAYGNFTPTTTPAPSIPEPGTWALMGLGLVGIAGASARRRQRNECHSQHK
jgi:hypothetical protein